MKQTKSIASRAEMAAFAANIATNLHAGDLVLLNGQLGAGKTFLSQSILKALGVTEQVTSPTFVMLKYYQGKLPINHVDAYRLLDLVKPLQAFEDLDIELDNSVTIVEWGEPFDVTGQALHIDIEVGELENRTVTIYGSDLRWGALKL